MTTAAKTGTDTELIAHLLRRAGFGATWEELQAAADLGYQGTIDLLFNPGDPESNDPDALIEQPFTSPEPTGGFLEVTVTPGDAPVAAFRWFDERGVLTYETVRTAGSSQGRAE